MEKTEPRRFLADRIAGGLLMAGFVILNVAWLWSIRKLSPSVPGQEWSQSLYPTVLGYIATALGLAANIWCSVGVCMGRRWAFVILALTAAQYAVRALDFSRGRLNDLGLQVPVAFEIVVFAYCGLRLVGTFGPQLGRLLPARDESRYAD